MKLYQHQEEAALWLAARKRAYLGDRPRVGKTAAICAALRNIGARHPIVVCPAIVRTHWRKNLAEFGIHDAGVFSYGHELDFSDAEALVLDEAHYLASPTAQRTRRLLGKNGTARRVLVVWCASGTPLPRHPGQYATVLLSLFPAVALAHGLRTVRDVQERFCIVHRYQTQWGWKEKVVGTQNDAEFREILDATMLARTLDDVGLDVPKLQWQQIELENVVGHEQFQLKEWAANDSSPGATQARHALGLVKSESVVHWLQEELTDQNEKLVVFAHHLLVLDVLQSGLGKFGVVRVDGSTPPMLRDAAMAAFQDPNSNVRVFLGQNTACQTGIDLTAASRVVLVEPDWVATINDQLGHRIVGVNQKATRVVAQMVSLAGTLDDAIVRQNVREAMMQNRMFPGGMDEC